MVDQVEDYAFSITPTSNGNYMVAAQTSSMDDDLSAEVHHGGRDCWVFKINGNNGDIVWQKTFGGSQNDDAKAVVIPDGYIAVGRSGSNNGDVSGNHGAEDVWVVKFKF